MDEDDRRLLEEVDTEAEQANQDVGCGNAFFLSGCLTFVVMTVHFAFMLNDSIGTKHSNPWLLYAAAIYPLAIVGLALLKRPWHALGITVSLAVFFLSFLACSIR